MLENAVIDHRDRGCVFDAEQEQQSAKGARRAGIFGLAQVTVLARPVDHVRKHASANKAILAAAAGHHRPAIIRRNRLIRRDVEVDAAHADGIADRHLPINALQRIERCAHIEHFSNVVIADEEHDNLGLLVVGGA